MGMGPLLAALLLAVAVADDREEAVVEDLDRVDVEDALLRRDELEVDRVRDGPDRPGARNLGHEVALDLLDRAVDALALPQAHVAEEHDAEDRVPEYLIDEDLRRDGAGVRARDLAVELAVEPVRRRAVHQQPEGRHFKGSVQVVLALLLDELLGQNITNREARHRRQALD